MPVTRWTREQVALLSEDAHALTPVIGDDGPPRLLPGLDFWDLWPVRTSEGALASVCGHELWAGLSSEAVGHPGLRHDRARIRLLARASTAGSGPPSWLDWGPLFPDGASAGSREWAGALTVDGGRLVAWYTAAGVRGEAATTFRQRIFTASATVECSSGRAVLTQWSHHTEAVRADGTRYRPADQATGEPGFIKAFRDPYPFRDPTSGADYLLFTASMAESSTDFDGCIGLARLGPSGHELLDPLVTADGVNNELERAQLVVSGGRYLLFFSTQARTFHPETPGPTGLYGLAADRVEGPYEWLNGSGLVLRNPPEEPYQAYSWIVLPDLTVVGFVDSFALHSRAPEELEGDGPDAVRAHFGGTMGPPSQLSVDGLRTRLRPL